MTTTETLSMQYRAKPHRCKYCNSTVAFARSTSGLREIYSLSYTCGSSLWLLAKFKVLPDTFIRSKECEKLVARKRFWQSFKDGLSFRWVAELVRKRAERTDRDAYRRGWEYATLVLEEDLENHDVLSAQVYGGLDPFDRGVQDRLDAASRSLTR